MSLSNDVCGFLGRQVVLHGRLHYDVQIHWRLAKHGAVIPWRAEQPREDRRGGGEAPVSLSHRVSMLGATDMSTARAAEGNGERAIARTWSARPRQDE